MTTLAQAPRSPRASRVAARQRIAAVPAHDPATPAEPHGARLRPRRGANDLALVLPPLRSLDEAKTSSSQLERLMAFGLDWLVRSLPAVSLAVFSPVDRRMNVFTDGPLVARHESSADLERLQRVRREYLSDVRALDPFNPSRWSQSSATVVSVRDVGGVDAFARSSYREFLHSHGIASQTSVFLRDRGRIAAVLVLWCRGDGDLGQADLALLRRSQPLLEQAYALALDLPVAEQPVDVLTPAGLTPRELEVARLAAEGATNAEIGRALYVSLATVKTHMTRVLTKTGARSRTELVMLMRSSEQPISA